ncbi:FAD-dependent monooxygenase [Micromonospora sp. WMMD882]|uniref:FAD-dependent monooxygenase n=1 Tax=Micromonospora sp. WMMD882 TaxID=3015151 RepID=UPI00248A9002|nr:FAD-dependent monooxygenase [Micromonospora sp. WMMD882]WBB81372.1 FAD-dependent monooxygenase [Micromonospora sp. WMMD882]
MASSGRHRTDVLVVGDGPVGLALVAELRRHGVAVVRATLDREPVDPATLPATRPATSTPPVAPVTPPTTRSAAPVRPPGRLDAIAAYDDGVLARVTDPGTSTALVLTAGYLVACDGASLPTGGGDPVGSHPARDLLPGVGAAILRRHGRLFRCGVVPPAGSAAEQQGVGVDDAVNLAWKLAATLRGWAGDGLLDSFADERRPRPGDGPSTPYARQRYRSAIVAADEPDPATDPTGVASDPATDPTDAPDAGVDPTDEARPGMPAPPVPSAATPVGPDLPGPGFTLVCLTGRWSPRVDVPYPPGVPALRAAFAAAGVPLTVRECSDAASSRRFRRPFALLRPDGYVAWRGWRPPADPAALVDLVRGATPRPDPTTPRPVPAASRPDPAPSPAPVAV